VAAENARLMMGPSKYASADNSRRTESGSQCHHYEIVYTHPRSELPFPDTCETSIVVDDAGAAQGFSRPLRKVEAPAVVVLRVGSDNPAVFGIDYTGEGNAHAADLIGDEGVDRRLDFAKRCRYTVRGLCGNIDVAADVPALDETNFDNCTAQVDS
jgi:hypothetical protein